MSATFIDVYKRQGCLRVSKESIFTGLHNFEINSIVDIDHDEQFGLSLIHI